ncbi:hypothetical protein [Mycobacterium pseudokansasii]|uniref:Uncharacterized protein n=1 Tax=Mycobacterium pseudokansasii TaxID=2341080 RepID=A0A498QZ87_9MYCO|nr:hypothetical protein [Mycobacterium pseudokansasii]VBA56027.1 hypothetical protein LAUMK142_05354 [Mycobacterium pseudokansasii]
MDDEFIPIAAAAADECGVPPETYISMLVNDGMLLVIPGTEDPRCTPDRWVLGGIGWLSDTLLPRDMGGVDMVRHVADCECGFIASPHPDIVPIGEAEL